MRRWIFAAALPAQNEADLLAALGTDPMPPVVLYMVAAGGTAVTVVVACVWLGNRYRDSVWIEALVATGQMALTLYVAHVVIGMGALEAAGVLEDRSLPFALLAAGIFCAAGAIFATIWRLRFRRGPLEWVMRVATEPRPRSG